jgi:hypothetical protein
MKKFIIYNECFLHFIINNERWLAAPKNSGGVLLYTISMFWPRFFSSLIEGSGSKQVHPPSTQNTLECSIGGYKNPQVWISIQLWTQLPPLHISSPLGKSKFFFLDFGSYLSQMTWHLTHEKYLSPLKNFFSVKWYMLGTRVKQILHSEKFFLCFDWFFFHVKFLTN